MTKPRVPKWVVIAFVTAGIGTGWTVTGRVVETSLPSAKPATLAQGTPNTTVGKEITDLELLRDALRRGVISRAQFATMEQKILAQALAP